MSDAFVWLMTTWTFTSASGLMLIPVDVNLMFKKIAMFNFYTLFVKQLF